MNQDRVVAHNLPDLSPLWDRAIGGGEATACAIDWEPNGMGYTIGWNRPSEGVVTHFRHNDGTIDWYSPIPQDVSSLEWSPIGDVIVVGLHDPGRMMIIDQIGTEIIVTLQNHRFDVELPASTFRGMPINTE